MEKEIANNIHNLMKEYNHSQLDFDSQKVQDLGEKLTKEVFKLPNSQHILAWNVIRDSFSQNLNNNLKEFSQAFGEGAMTVIETSEDRENFLNGFSLLKQDQDFVMTPISKTIQEEKKFDVSERIDITSANENIHTILNDFHKNNPNITYTEIDKLSSLGMSIANEMIQIPYDKHVAIWNVVSYSFSKNSESNSSKIGIPIGEGALKVLDTYQDSENFTKGYSLSNLFDIESNNSKKIKPR